MRGGAIDMCAVGLDSSLVYRMESLYGYSKTDVNHTQHNHWKLLEVKCLSCCMTLDCNSCSRMRVCHKTRLFNNSN